MIIKQKLAITMIILFSLAMIIIPTPTVYATIEKVKKYAEDICIQTFKGDWDGKDCDIQEAKDEQKYYADIASLEDSICKKSGQRCKP